MIPNYLLDQNNLHFNFRPSEIIFVDREHGMLLKAHDISSVSTRASMSYDIPEWELAINGCGILKVEPFDSGINISDEDVINIVASDMVGE